MPTEKSAIPSPNSIIVRLRGGLGNQIWQYTAGLALYSQYADAPSPPEIWVDVSCYNHESNNDPDSRPFLLDRLFPNLRLCWGIPAEIENRYLLFGEPYYYSFCNQFLSLPSGSILDGYFQHYRYFEMAKQYLKPDIASIPIKYRNFQENYTLVAVHIRRGDYLSEQCEGYFGTAPLEYYWAALQKIKSELTKPYILFFSDDLAWIRKYLIPYVHKFDLPFDIPDGDVLEDFALMSHCKHFIVANSSLSLLAAMLGQKEHSILLTPQMWHLSRNIKSKEYLPSEWQVPDYSFYKEPVLQFPLVSIIIPVYNNLNYLDRCLESVCLQTEQNIEIIIVDDASPDDSWQLIQEYTNRDSRIVPIRHEANKRQGGARNTGIRAARGEWLLFVDSDDYIRRDTVEIFLTKSEKYPDIKLLVCSISKVEEKTGQINFFCGSDVDTLICDPFVHYCEYRYPFIQNCPWAKLWKRELFVCVSFPEHLLYEDLDTIPRLLVGLDKCLYISERLFYYQESIKSVTGNNFLENKVRDICRVFSRLYLWGLDQSTDRQLFLNGKLLKEIDAWLMALSEIDDRKNRTDFLEIFLKSVPEILFMEYFWGKLKDAQRFQSESAHFQSESAHFQSESAHFQQNRWYRFGQLSRKGKIWVIVKVLSKKFKIYWLLKPFAQVLSNFLKRT